MEEMEGKPVDIGTPFDAYPSTQPGKEAAPNEREVVAKLQKFKQLQTMLLDRGAELRRLTGEEPLSS